MPCATHSFILFRSIECMSFIVLMTHHVDPDCRVHALERSAKLALSMLRDMSELEGQEEQSSMRSMLRHIASACNCKTDKMTVGERPCPDSVVPHMGSSFSQADDSGDTPATRVTKADFTEQPHCADSIGESWNKLPPEGHLFINSRCSQRPTSDAALLERVKRTTELTCITCFYMQQWRPTKKATRNSLD
jgi:hypothetical protein